MENSIEKKEQQVVNYPLNEMIDLYFELNGLVETSKTKDGKVVPIVKFNGLLKQDLPVPLKFILTKNSTMLKDCYDFYEKERHSLFKQYGEEVDSGTRVQIKPEHLEIFTKKYDELENTETKMDSLIKFEISLLEKADGKQNYPMTYKYLIKENG